MLVPSCCAPASDVRIAIGRARPIPMKADGGLVYDVKNFGAVGDGVTDDTRAIQSALDYAVDHGGGTVYFPNGLYRLATLQDTCKVRAHLIVKPRQSPGRRDYVMIRLQGESSVVTPCSYASHTTEDKAEVWKTAPSWFRTRSASCRPILRKSPYPSWPPEPETISIC